MFLVEALVDDDLDGDAADDLDEVAGCVLGGEGGEAGAGALLDALDVAVQLEVRVGVDGDVDALADGHAGELGFLEVGDDPGVGGDEIEGLLPDLNVGSDVDVAAGDEAVLGGVDVAVGEVQLRLGEVGFGLFDLGLALLEGAFGDGDVLRHEVCDLFGRLGLLEGGGLRLELVGGLVDGGLGGGAGVDAALALVLAAGVVLVGPGLGELGGGLQAVGRELHPGDLQVELGTGELGAGEVEVGARHVAGVDVVARVDAEHEVAGVDEGVVVDVALDDVAGDLGGDGDGVALGVGVVGGDLVAGEVPIGCAADGREDDDGDEDDDGPAALLAAILALAVLILVLVVLAFVLVVFAPVVLLAALLILAVLLVVALLLVVLVVVLLVVLLLIVAVLAGAVLVLCGWLWANLAMVVRRLGEVGAGLVRHCVPWWPERMSGAGRQWADAAPGVVGSVGAQGIRPERGNFAKRFDAGEASSPDA